jgi:Zn-dependent M28 family amino/carboxypeptidase
MLLLLLLWLQDRPAAKAETVVEAAVLRRHVEYLASDEFKGRMCGSPENVKASEYIADVYKKLGLAPMGDEDDGGVRSYFQQFSFRAEGVKAPFHTRNVIAVLPGSDPKVKDEIVVLGAHFDHVGTAKDPDPGRNWVDPDAKDIIFNGADDNASGTAALLMLAQAFASGELKPRRTMVFGHFNGEEWGMKGSEAYLKDPPFPLKNHVAMLNFDMVGRNSERPVWAPLAESCSDGLELKLKIIKPAVGSTDFHSFLKKKIPAAGFFTDFHADYHGTRDSAEKLDYNRMAKIVRLALRMAMAVADADERPEWTAPPPK